MKKMIIASLMLVSAVSFASERKNISFTYFGNSGMNRQFYACSYVEDQTTAYLETFGATGIEVYCSGGIQPYGAYPVSLQASFDLPVVSGNSVQTIKIEGDTWNPNCGINTRIINEALKQFKNIQVVKKSDACAFTNSNYSYELKISL